MPPARGLDLLLGARNPVRSERLGQRRSRPAAVAAATLRATRTPPALRRLVCGLGSHGSNLVGLNWGRALLAIAIVVAVWRVRRQGGPSRGLWVVLALGVGFWFLASLNAYSFLREPSDGRYQYPGAIFVLLIAAELLRGARLDRRVLAGATVVTAAAIVSGIIFLHDGYELRRSASQLERARLAAVELSRPSVRPDFTVDLDLVTSFKAGSYFSAVDAFGSPAYSQSELASSAETNRQVADQLLASALGIRLTPATSDLNPGLQDRVRCTTSEASPTGTPLVVPLGARAYTLMAPKGSAAEIHMARFADQPAVDLGALRPGRVELLDFPPDRATRPWRLALVGSGPVKICPVG